MAPVKFEENIKGKLEKRTLTPTSDSWSKLAQRLDDDKKKSKIPLFWWLGIAAGILVMMAISIQFYNSNEAKDIRPQLVEDNMKKDQLNGSTTEQQDVKNYKLANEEHEEDTKVDIPSTQVETQPIDFNKKDLKGVKAETQLAEHNASAPLHQETILNNEVDQLLNEAIMENALAEARKTLLSDNHSVSDQEIDSLLRVASKELFKPDRIDQTSTVVDAQSLLTSVEDEMGQSFRTKVFEALKESYETARSAIADRNN